MDCIGMATGANLAFARAEALLVAAEKDFRESETWPYFKDLRL
jgi:Tfp pilus assembly protein PilX